MNNQRTKKMAETDTENKRKLMNPHTAGNTSFALICNDLEKKRELLYHLRRYLWPQEQDIPDAEMEEIERQQSADGNESIDAFSSVMGPEHPGRLILYGRGVTKTSLKRKEGNSQSSLNATNDAVQQMEEWIQKLEEQLEEQSRTIQQEATANIIAQLQHTGLISEDILAPLSVPLPGEATSAPQTNQLIHRPTTSSNNRGSESE